jgi:hypothetical protein
VFQRRPAEGSLQGCTGLRRDERSVNVGSMGISGVLRVDGVWCWSGNPSAQCLVVSLWCASAKSFPLRDPAPPVNAGTGRITDAPQQTAQLPLRQSLRYLRTLHDTAPPTQPPSCGKHAPPYLSATPQSLTRRTANTSSTPKSRSARRAVGASPCLRENEGSRQPGKKWFDCAECHAEQADHALTQTFDMVFICKKCKKAFRKDAREFEDAWVPDRVDSGVHG